MNNIVRYRILTVVAIIGGLVLLAFALPAYAADTTLFGGSMQQSGAVRMHSVSGNASTTDDYSGIAFSVPATTTFASLGTLSATFNVLGTDCSSGSPRFQINVTNGTTTGNIHAYLGPEPNYTGCTQNTAVTSGNLLGGPRTLDTSQLPGGTFYDTWDHASTTYGAYQVTGVQLVTDAGWALSGGTQTVDVTNANVGGTVYSLTAPALLAPVNLMPVSGTATTSASWNMADWDNVTSSFGPVTYRYESSHSAATDTDGSFSNPLFESGILTDSHISTANTPNGTYYWHVRAVDDLGVMSPWSTTAMITISDATTTPPIEGDQELINALEALQDRFPQFGTIIQLLINLLTDDGETPPPPQTGTARMDNPNVTVNVGGSVDFGGRGFGHEETVVIRRDGTQVGTAHADGGGNFTTGSMSVPSTPGTYTYTFMGQNSGMTATSVVTVQ